MRSLTVLNLILFCSFYALAQNDVIDGLVADYERAKFMSLAYVDAMPEDKFSFKPNDEIRSYAEQFLHAAQGTIGLTANGTGAERIYGDDNLEKNPDYQSKDEVRRLVIESFDYTIESIEKMDPSTFNEIVEAGPFKVTKIGWVYKAHEHLTHHRGQCAIYLRLNDITPPQFALF